MPNYLELYSASLLTVMFVAAVFLWVRDEVRRRRRPVRRPLVISTQARDPEELRQRRLERHAALLALRHANERAARR